MIRFRASILFAGLAWFGCCLVAPADESPVAPLLFDEAFLVVRIDLDKVQVQPLYEMLDNSIGRGTFPSPKAVEDFVANLRGAGVRHLYVFGDGMTGVALVPHVGGADSAAIKSALLKGPLAGPLTLEQTADTLQGIGALANSMLNHLRQLKAQPRTHLAAALDATSDCTLQLLILPTEGNRQQAATFFWPFLQFESTAKAMNLLAWASIGIDGPPRGRLKIVFEAKDASLAEPLAAALSQSLEPLLIDPAVSKNLALVERLREIFTWKRSGSTVSLDIDDRQGELTVVARGMFQPVVQVAQAAAGRALATNRFKQIGLAFQNYHDVKKSFPPPAILDGDGKPLLSWHIAILPFIDEVLLFRKFHLDEPWDSPHNKPLLAEMPEIFRCPLARIADDHTVFLTPRGGGSVFAGPEAISIRRIIDGTSKTISHVEVDDDHAVPWTKPDDWNFDPDNPTAGLGGHFRDVILCRACDGSVHALPLEIDPDVLRSLMSCAGPEPIAFP